MLRFYTDDGPRAFFLNRGNFVYVILFVVVGMFSGALLGCAKTPPPEPATSDDWEIQRVIPVPGVAKDAIFERAKSWVGGAFSPSLDVIQYANRRTGVVRGKTSIPHVRPKKWSPPDRFDYRFTVIVEAKDERMRVTFKDVYMMGVYGREPILKTDMAEISPKIEMAIDALVASFAAEKKADDW